MSFGSRAHARALSAALPRFHPFGERLGLLVFSLALLFALSQPVLAHEFKAGTITIDHPWSRATSPVARVAAGYVTLENTGTEPDRLLSATAEIAGRAEVHEMSVDAAGVMTMRPVEGGLEIPAGQTVKLEPGAFHLMLMNLQSRPEAGKPFKGTLTFEKGGTVEVEFAVEPIGATKGDTPDHSGHGG